MTAGPGERSGTTGLRRLLPAPGRPKLQDAGAGLVTGLFSIPEGMA
ncbi:hypothetical protein [Streptomyces sp. NPDC090080]